MENQSLRFTQPYPLIPMSTCEVPKPNHCVPMFFVGLSSKERNSVVCCHTLWQSPVRRLSSFYTSFHLRRYQKPITTLQCLRSARDLNQIEMSCFGNPRLSSFFYFFIFYFWRSLNLRKHENDSAITRCLRSNGEGLKHWEIWIYCWIICLQYDVLLRYVRIMSYQKL